MAIRIPRRTALGLAAAAVVVAGTGLALKALPGESSAADPPDLRLGQHTCDQCGMVISDERFAAGWRASGSQQRFDDIGCMITNYRNAGRPNVKAWVHDYDSHSWIPAAPATFVVSSTINSPMAYGVAALNTSEAAAALATASGGSVTGWDPLVETLPAGAQHG